MTIRTMLLTAALLLYTGLRNVRAHVAAPADLVSTGGGSAMHDHAVQEPAPEARDLARRGRDCSQRAVVAAYGWRRGTGMAPIRACDAGSIRCWGAIL